METFTHLERMLRSLDRVKKFIQGFFKVILCIAQPAGKNISNGSSFLTVLTKNNFSSINNTIILYTAISLLSIIFFSLPDATAEDINGKEYFKNGKNDLDSGRYAEAVKSLSVAQKEFPLLEDYIVFYLSEAYHKLGDHDKSLDTIRILIEKHHRSPLKKRARMSEIREAQENSREDLIQLFESYVKDYPEDDEISFMYGLFLKESDEIAKATALFKNIYIRAGVLSNAAYSHLSPSDIDSTDLIKRALKLIKKYEFIEAERNLRKAMSMDDGRNRNEILKSLGLTLFRLKKYKKAAEIYDKTGDIYSKARSLYRAGNKREFQRILNTLIAENHRKAGYLLVADASDKRRAGDYENALKIYNDVIKKYPLATKGAMWGIGWTHYVSGKYRKSAEIFSKLYYAYKDPKYLYWQARSIEAMGENAADIYESLMQMDSNYYGFLSYAKNLQKIRRSVSLNEIPDEIPSDTLKKFERVEALQLLGLIKESSLELKYISKRTNSPEEFIYIISKFQELGEFKHAIGLSTKIPYSEKLHHFWYPLAFWDTVEQVSKKYNLDPLIALSVIREESRFDAYAKSPAGARGLMQVMPQTAYRLNKRLKLGINKASQLYDVKNNVRLGLYYLKNLFNEFNSLAHVLAAYNAGEAIVRKWERNSDYKSVDEFIEDIPYPETRNYVKKVITSYFQYKKFSTADNSEADSGVLMGIY
jgi:soluble lytic murein transglycosylase